MLASRDVPTWGEHWPSCAGRRRARGWSTCWYGRAAAVVDELLELAPEFQRAYQEGAGDNLRELSTRRQRLVAALVRDAERLAKGVGVRLSADAAREVEGTLGAALVDPDVADQVLAGRLTSPVPYAGFGPAWISPAPTGASVFQLAEPADSGGRGRKRSGKTGGGRGGDSFRPARRPRGSTAAEPCRGTPGRSPRECGGSRARAVHPR